VDDKVLIVGAAPGNIGSAIDAALGERIDTDAISIDGLASIPTVQDIYEGNYRHLIISCGFMEIKPLAQMEAGMVGRIVTANLTTPLAIIRNFINATTTPQPDEECCVIVIGSYGHDHVLSNSAPYCAAKAGINHAIKCLAWDYTGQGYRFHCVNPHSVEDTPMTEKVIEQIKYTKGIVTTEAAVAYWKNSLQLPERLTRAEVGKTVAWLLLDAPTPHLSGTSIELYGGER
jgi:NAD(P)-dependent dehydrogenase (short-subunit alcohol dehydrogenase family)